MQIEEVIPFVQVLSQNSERILFNLKRDEQRERKSIEQKIKTIRRKKEFCRERGYHRVEKDAENDLDVMECYDCKTGFSRDIAKETGLIYRIEKLSN